jgi:hypothetical protein
MRYRFIIIIILWIVSLAGNSFLQGLFPSGQFLNLVVICLVVYAFFADLFWATILAFGLGFFADIYSPYFFGLYIAVNVGTAYVLAGKLKHWFARSTLFAIFIIASITYMVWNMLFFAFYILNQKIGNLLLPQSVQAENVLNFIGKMLLNAGIVTIILGVSIKIISRLRKQFFVS